jgi:hypothetical protein
MTKITNVTASTKKDNPKIDFAGVDAGAKMLVELKGEPEGWAAAAVT